MPNQVPCCLNLAAVSLKKSLHEDAKKLCLKVLEVDPSNPKALFRLGQAMLGLQDYEEALVELQKARALQPRDKSIVAAIEKVNKVKKEYEASQKAFFAKAFQ